MKEYKFAGNIKIRVEEAGWSNFKISIDDPDDILNNDKIPRGGSNYGNSSSHDRGEMYYGVPMIFKTYGNKWWINLSVLDGKHDWDGGEEYAEPICKNKEWTEKLIKAMKMVVDKFIEIGYIKENLIVHTFGYLKVILDKKSEDEVYVRFEGLKEASELPEEYVKGYPSIVKHSYGVKIKTCNGKYLYSDGSERDWCYLISESSEKSMSTAMKIVDTVASSVMRLNEIKEKSKLEKEYDFGSMKVKFNITDRKDKVTLTIEGLKPKSALPAEYLSGYPCIYNDGYADDRAIILKNEDGECVDNHYRTYTGCIHLWVTGTTGGSPDRITLDVAEKIAELIGKCAERLREINKPKEVVKEVETMEEFKGLSKYVNSVVYDFDGCTVEVKRTDDVDKFEISVNAGPYDFENKYSTPGDEYSYRPYSKIKYRIELSNYDTDGEHWWVTEPYVCGGWHKFFMNGDKVPAYGVNVILRNVKGGVEFKKAEMNKPKEPEVKLMTESEMKTLIAEGTFTHAEISLQSWQSKLEYVKRNKTTRYEYIPNYSVNNCALCNKYNNLSNSCEGCPLKEIGDRCTYNSGSSYTKVFDYRGENHCEFVELVKGMVRSLEKALEYEKEQAKKPKCDVQLPDKRTVFNFSGIKVTVTPNGVLYKISIDSNGYDLAHTAMHYKEIHINDNFIYGAAFWIDSSYRNDWYVTPAIRDLMPREDQSKFNAGQFDNGIELTAEGTLVLINCLKLYFEECNLVKN